MIGLHDLQYFKTISEQKNLRKAALALHISQPALSHCLNRLEAELGVVLVERQKTGIILTRAGTKFLQSANGLIAEWSSLKRTLNSDESIVSGTFVLGCHPSVALYSLKHFMKDLLLDNNQIEVKLVHDISRNITEGIIESKIDVGIVVNPVSHPDLVIIPMFQDEVTLWKSKSTNIGSRLIYDPQLSQTQWLLKKLGKKSLQFEQKIESSNLEVIADLVRGGVGVGILPERVARSSDTVDVVRAFTDAPTYKDEICLVFKPHFRQSVLGNFVINCIKKAKI